MSHPAVIGTWFMCLMLQKEGHFSIGQSLEQERLIDREGLAGEDRRTNSQIPLKKAQNSGVFCVKGSEER